MSRATMRDERRNQIILALKDCLREKSYTETSIKDIANKANLAPGLIHYYFNTKEEILIEMYNNASGVFYKSLLEWISTLAESKMNMTAFIAAISSYIKSSYNETYSAVYSSIWTMGNYMPALKAQLKFNYERYETELANALKKVLPNDADVNSFSRLMHVYLDGLMVLSSIYDLEAQDKDILTDFFLQLCKSFY